MVVRQCNDHDGPYHNLSIHDNGSILGCVHPCYFKFTISLSSWSLQAERSHAPSTADCGRLIMGVPYNDPNTPPLELSVNFISKNASSLPSTRCTHIVNDPPAMSSRVSLLSFAYSQKGKKMSFI